MANPEELGGEVNSQLPTEILSIVDWGVQAEGCRLMYGLTGDTDYELMRIEAEANAIARNEQTESPA